MNLALIQPACVEKSRSACLQEVLKAIDSACDAIPAPDLVGLPGFAPTGGSPPGRGWTPAQCDAGVEAFCAKAREWGVYIALGAPAVVDHRVDSVALLIDPDGDVALRSGADASGAEIAPALIETAVGRIGVTVTDILMRAAGAAGGWPATDVLIVPAPRGLSMRRVRFLRELAGSTGEALACLNAAHLVLLCAGSAEERRADAEEPGTMVIGGGAIVSAPAAHMLITSVVLECRGVARE